MGSESSESDHVGELFKAVSEGNLSNTTRLIENQFSVQAFKNLSSTLLHQAANNHRSQILEYLLLVGAYVDGKNAQQLTPLHIAARVGDVTSLKVLLKNGANINEVDYENRTPLYFSVYSGHHECVQEILTIKDVNLHIVRKGGWTHLHEAARFGHLKCMKLIIRYVSQ